MPNRSSRGAPIASLAAATMALALAAIGRGEPPRPQLQDPKTAASPLTKAWSTAESCNICHREDAKATQKVTDFVKLGEVDAWEKLDKHHDGFKSLSGDRGRQMKERLGYDVSSDARCLSCHAPAAILDPKDTAGIAEGVSCVSCHGPHKEWVKAHGGVGDKAEQEKWIDTSPEVKRDKFGMTDLRSPSVRASTCASCHVGSAREGRVVTHEMYAAGHPPLPGLEVSTFSEAEPPHWWAMKDVPYLDLSDRALGRRFGAPNIRAQKPRIEALRKNYRVDEFPTQQAKLVAVGGVVTFREAMELFAATAPTGREGNPDFARFDCASCHHDLTVSEDSFRQKRGFAGDPGRPPAAEWPSALVSIAIAAGDPSQKDTRTKQLEEGLGRFREAVAKQPFGGSDKAAVAEAGALATWANDLAADLDARKFGRDDAIRILRQIARISPRDHASARQLAWAFRGVYNELADKPANDKEIAATIDGLVGSLGIRLQKGSAPGTIEREVGARLDADDRFKPEEVRRLLARLDELLK